MPIQTTLQGRTEATAVETNTTKIENAKTKEVHYDDF